MYYSVSLLLVLHQLYLVFILFTSMLVNLSNAAIIGVQMGNIFCSTSASKTSVFDLF